MVRFGLGRPGILVEAEVLGRPLVVGVDAEEEHDEGRDGDDDHPGALGELGDQEDDSGDGRDARAEAVDGGAAAPAGRAFPPPVHDQPRLGQREPDEHPDGEEGDQLVGVAVDGDEQRAGQDTVSTRMPLPNVCRSPRMLNRCGR